MKQHLVKLLLEEYKQQCLFNELAEKGVDMKNICVNNFDIVLDIIGFPPDNTIEYDYDYLNSNGEIRDTSKKIFDNELFCRDWLFDTYSESMDQLIKEQKVSVSDLGMQIESGADRETAELKLSEFIDWLYTEFDKLKSIKPE